MKAAASTLRIPYAELSATLADILLRRGFAPDRALLCARLFAETTRDGVYSHGVNRFPRFIRMMGNGSIDIHAQPRVVSKTGALERWDGQRGPGNLNAYASMARAIEIARTEGIGCVALANTNHWMRGGSYGWQAAEAGAISICWTNTLPNLPPWGGTLPALGNNPLVIAVPRAEGHVVLDTAMSQFSYGALAEHGARGEQLPVDGGFDSQGNLTRDPGAIEASQRPLPIGYWKGSGLSLVLDMIAAMLSGGAATHQIARDPEHESGVSQVFIAFSAIGNANPVADSIIDSLRAEDAAIRYPGEQVLRVRKENLAQGVPVNPAVWVEVLGM
ncbi:MAG TPA: 3-dehydro-L-gulonate 2-dehydrogenase [Candidatus Solibacter sp.]|jgi:3-dehydro-L-gulonate 2-dehydrogenase